ncbi:uncharacterized protein [Venturia canescens]|uniref:uncharacterized protein n=1 Tax=Venturia canescens TaxID=32260 RepID=UPI001C9C33B7|nr:uncharacterized protein LOC122417037 [Venturia canescens]
MSARVSIYLYMEGRNRGCSMKAQAPRGIPSRDERERELERNRARVLSKCSVDGVFPSQCCSQINHNTGTRIMSNNALRSLVKRAFLGILSSTRKNQKIVSLQRKDITFRPILQLFSSKSSVWTTFTEAWTAGRKQMLTLPKPEQYCHCTQEERKSAGSVVTDQMPRTRRRHRSRSHSRTRSHSAGSPQYDHKRRRIDYESPQTKGTYR